MFDLSISDPNKFLQMNTLVKASPQESLPHSLTTEWRIHYRQNQSRKLIAYISFRANNFILNYLEECKRVKNAC